MLPLIAIVSTSVISPTISKFIRRHYVGPAHKIQQTSNARHELLPEAGAERSNCLVCQGGFVC
jgi:hypothetical protein